MKLVKDTDNKNLESKQVSDKEAEEALIKILTWIGEDPNREGLLETPKSCLLYTSPSPRDLLGSRMPSSA